MEDEKAVAHIDFHGGVSPGEFTHVPCPYESAIGFANHLWRIVELSHRTKFARKMRSLREARGLTLQQAAELYGVSQTQVHNYENPRKAVFPLMEQLIRIAHVYGVTPNDLLGFNTTPKTEKVQHH